MASKSTPAAAPEPGGFFRNIGEGVLTLLHDAETVVLHPSRIVKLAWTPAHRDVVEAAASDFEAQAEADAKAVAERAAARAAKAAAEAAATLAPVAAPAPADTTAAPAAAKGA